MKALPDRIIRAPNWSQLNDPNPDGKPDSARDTDCGEECAAIVIYLCRGVELPAGYIRYKMGLPSDSGISNGSELCKYLKSQHLSAELRWVDVLHLEQAIHAAVDWGTVLICLGNWLSPDVGHWVVANGYGSGRMFFLDPWSGQEHSLPWDMAEGFYSGQIVDPHEYCKYRG